MVHTDLGFIIDIGNQEENACCLGISREFAKDECDENVFLNAKMGLFYQPPGNLCLYW